MKTLSTITLSTIIFASLLLSANTATAINSSSYTPQCGGGQVTVVNPIGIDTCREAKDSSIPPHCLIALANQSPSKKKGWYIEQMRANDVCKLKLQKKTSNIYVRSKPVCEGSYKLKIDSKGLQDRCIKITKHYRIACKKDEVHLTKGLDKCIANKLPL